MTMLNIRALAATSLALLAPAAAAEAAPTVSVQGDRAVFADQGAGPTTDNLEVEAVRDGEAYRYEFYLRSGPIVVLPSCTPGLEPGRATCTVTGATGVDVDLGEPAAVLDTQYVTLLGQGWAGQATSLTGGSSADVLRGGAGNDVLNGLGDPDEFIGGPGVDTVTYEGYASADQPVRASINGLADSGIGGCSAACERDTIHTDIENLTGGAGGDVLSGSPDANMLRGGGGDDRLIGGLGADGLDGGTGTDTADYLHDGRTAGIDVDLVTGTQNVPGGAPEDTLVPGTIENVIGTDAADLLNGDRRENMLDAAGGDDVVEVVDAAVDSVFCGAGTDTVRADDLDQMADGWCETVTREAPAPDDEEPEEPSGACSDPETCQALVLGVFREAFGCDSMESCTAAYPVPGGGGGGGGGVPGAPGGPPCADPDGCAELVGGVFREVFGCDSVESCQEQYPVPGGGGEPGGPPCGDPTSCGAALQAAVREVFGCDSIESCGEQYPAPGGGAPPSPCSDPGSCGEYFAGVLRDNFGCDSPETCQELYGPPPGGSDPPAQQPAPQSAPGSGSGQAPTTGSSSATPDGEGGRAVRRQPRLRLRVTPRRDRRKPHLFEVRGTLVRPAGVPVSACRGGMVLTISTGKRRVQTIRVRVSRGCSFRAVFALRRARSGPLRVRARFLGNAALTPRRSPAARVRTG